MHLMILIYNNHYIGVIRYKDLFYILQLFPINEYNILA